MRQVNQQFASILTKIGNGKQLDEIEITLIVSRFCTVEEAELRCPEDIRLSNTNNSVNEYNNKILNAYAGRIPSTAKDVYIGCTSKEQETSIRQKLHKMSLIDTNGLPYQTVYVNNIYYMIITNIDVTYGMPNGAFGELIYVETNSRFTSNRGKIKTQKDHFALTLQNNRIISTTKSNTMIDAVFPRFLNDIEYKS
ncbi:ATP-dependent DNA helicase [Trichonephila clavipes]|nr:ATP-dependent DNA helicase [Trichonephila clavipes]